jgi:pimeloyl-ACP methyl ester carboxylesterase
VLLHAFPLNARMWEPQLSMAELGWRVIAPHVRAMDGASDERPIASLDDVVGDVVDLLDGLKIEEAVFCGLSMGGYAALALFRLAPRYVGGLVLADTRAEADSAEAREGRLRTIRALAERGTAPVVADLLPKLLSEETRRLRPQVAVRVRELALSSSADALAGAVGALMTRQDSTALLSHIRCPTLVIVGEHDAITPPSAAEGLRRAIAGAELVTIPSAGHLSSLERPEAFNTALAAFLQQRL